MGFELLEPQAGPIKNTPECEKKLREIFHWQGYLFIEEEYQWVTHQFGDFCGEPNQIRTAENGHLKVVFTELLSEKNLNKLLQKRRAWVTAKNDQIKIQQ
jgi:hypothetical protein